MRTDLMSLIHEYGLFQKAAGRQAQLADIYDREEPMHVLACKAQVRAEANAAVTLGRIRALLGMGKP